MATLKGTTDRIAGKLSEEGKAQQRKAEVEPEEPGEANPLKPLNKLT